MPESWKANSETKQQALEYVRTALQRCTHEGLKVETYSWDDGETTHQIDIRIMSDKDREAKKSDLQLKLPI